MLKLICDQLFWRDGSLCPFTGFSFTGPGRCVYPRSAHILPFSFQDKVRGIVSQWSLIVILLHHSLLRLRRSKSLLDDSSLQNWLTTSTTRVTHSIRKRTLTIRMINWHGASRPCKMAIRWIIFSATKTVVWISLPNLTVEIFLSRSLFWWNLAYHQTRREPRDHFSPRTCRWSNNTETRAVIL